MERTELVEKIIEFFGEREDVGTLVKVITEINNLYKRVEKSEREWNDWNSYHTK